MTAFALDERMTKLPCAITLEALEGEPKNPAAKPPKEKGWPCGHPFQLLQLCQHEVRYFRLASLSQSFDCNLRTR